MRVRDKLRGYSGEIVGVIGYDAWRGIEFAIVTDGGMWSSQYACDLEPLIEPDMRITVGHVIDNPTLSFDGAFEITATDDDGTVHTLWGDNNDEFPDADILTRNITYMIITPNGRLRIEVG